MKTFIKNLIDPEFTLGAADYYVVMLFFDILCLFTIAVGVNSFGVKINSKTGTQFLLIIILYISSMQGWCSE